MTLKTQHRELGRQLDEPLSTFDIPALLSHLKKEKALKLEGRNSIILHKGRELRVVLVTMMTGAKIPSHTAEHPISVQVLEGSMLLNTDNGSVRLNKGQIATLHGGIRHDIEAIDAPSFLLTLATE